MFAVVEHQQPHPALQGGGHTPGHAAAGLLGDAQHRGHRVRHRSGIGDRGQLEKPYPVREFVYQPPRHFQRQPGLADPAHPGQRDQPMSLHRGLHLAGLRIAPDEARRRGPQVPQTRIQRPQGRELRAQPCCSDLEHPDRCREIPQPTRSQIDKTNAAKQTRSRVGHQDLTAVPGGHHACGPIQNHAEIVARTQFGFAGPQPHAHRQLQPALRGHRGIHSRTRRGERGAHPVTGVLEHPTPVRLDRRAQHLVMGGQGDPHRVRVGLPPTGRTLNVGEQEGHDTLRSGHLCRMSQRTLFHLEHHRTTQTTRSWSAVFVARRRGASPDSAPIPVSF